MTAKIIDVGLGSRIDVNGRGYGGGNDANVARNAAATTAPGASPATDQYGGSHGGVGGAPRYPTSGHRGATYDSATDPKQPGSGGAGETSGSSGGGTSGGGVLLIKTGVLNLTGALLAEGEDGAGPNLDDWSVLDTTSGAGAGGAIQVRAGTLTGKGVIAADGGSVCPGRTFFIRGVICGSDTGGAGSGGRIAVYATTHAAFHGKLVAMGGVNSDVKTPEHRWLGTVYHSWR